VLEVTKNLMPFAMRMSFWQFIPDFIVQRMCIGTIVVDGFLTETILPLDKLVFLKKHIRANSICSYKLLRPLHEVFYRYTKFHN
jgi:hypothetical protein